MSEATMFQDSVAAIRYPSVVPTERAQPPARRDDERAAPGEFFAVLWRRRSWIALGMIAGLIGAGLFLAFATPKYTAAAQILIDPNDLRVIENAVTSSSAPADTNTAYVESQVRVLASDNVLRKVIEQQALDRDVEFVPAPSAFSLAREYISSTLGLAASAPPADPAVTALQNIGSLVVARRQERTYVVDLLVTTRDAKKSAAIANAIIQ